MNISRSYQCRLCLTNTRNKVDIFKHDFPKMIEILTGIKVYPNDNLPKESCLKCARDVKFCMSIRKKIIQSHKTLLENVVKDQLLFVTNRSNSEIAGKSSITAQGEAEAKLTVENTSASGGDETQLEEENSLNNCVFEEILLPELLLQENIKSEDISIEYPEIKHEESISLPKTDEAELSNNNKPLLTAERLLKKRNLIFASKKILNQEHSVISNNEYGKIYFIRKPKRDKLLKTEQQQTINKKKTPIVVDDDDDDDDKKNDSNVIWKNGKKYAACEICKREVKKQYLKYHMNTHFPEHFSCDVCGVTTRNLRGLRYHKLYWHSSKLDYICDKCGKKYRSKHALELHNKKEHGGVRDLECNICGKKFFQKINLKNHIDGIHKKLRPHRCEYCGKDFAKRTHLVTHWRTHTNETPYPCEMCGERFKLKLSLKNHLRRAHNFEEKERVFCGICNRGFASDKGLRAHINSRIHEGEKCPHCSESFMPEYLRVHLKEVHNFF